MKVLGISFGRKMKNCEILVKEALMGAEAAGAEVAFVRTIDLDIGHCIGCGACSAGMRKSGRVRCVLHDDYEALSEAVLEADAVVVAAPVYVLAPAGQFKNFVDRFGPAHDGMALEEERLRREKSGEAPMDPRYFKQRYVGYISVGGASTHHWVSFGLPGMALFGLASMMKLVDQVDAYNMGRTGNPVLSEPLLERVGRLGRNVALACGRRREQVDFCGDEPGICPVCHNSLLLVGKTTTVRCPVCGIEGKLSVDGDKLSVSFSAQEQSRARSTPAGQQEHVDELNEIKAYIIPIVTERAREILGKMKKYENFHELELRKK